MGLDLILVSSVRLVGVLGAFWGFVEFGLGECWVVFLGEGDVIKVENEAD